MSATACFDPVGGELTGRVFNSMPPNGVVIGFGSLDSGKITGIDGVELRWGNKRLEGFTLYRWWPTKTADEQRLLAKFVTENYKTLFSTKI